MNKVSRAALTGLFVLSGLIHTKNADAQTDLPRNDVRTGIVMGGNKNEEALSKIDDKAFLARQDSLGMNLKTRGTGLITMKDEQGHTRQGQAMFYTYEKEVDGKKVESRTILAHHWDEKSDKFDTSHLFYRDVKVTDAKGNLQGALTCNRTSVFGNDETDYITCATNEKGKQTLIKLTADDIFKGMDGVIGNNPDAVAGFAHDAVARNRKLKSDVVPVPGFSGQDLGNGTFQIINVANLTVGGVDNQYTGPGGP